MLSGQTFALQNIVTAVSCPPFSAAVEESGGLNVRYGPEDPEILYLPPLSHAKLLCCLEEMTYFSAPFSPAVKCRFQSIPTVKGHSKDELHNAPLVLCRS